MWTHRLGDEPGSGTRHPHGGRVRRPIATTQHQVLIGLRLKSRGAYLVPSPSMVRGQSVIAIEEVDVRLGREVGILSRSCDPDQDSCSQEIGSKPHDRFTLAFSHFCFHQRSR